jgi:hypothetical protein
VLAAAVLAAPCGCTTIPVSDGLTGPIKPLPPGEGVLLRLKFAENQVLRYDTKFKVSSEGFEKTSSTDSVRAVVYKHCLGPDRKHPGFWKTNIQRREVSRLKKAVTRHGERLPPINVPRTIEPNVSGTCPYDPKTNKHYYPVTDRNMFGTSKRYPYHWLWYDSALYLLPVLPPGNVVKGTSWSMEIPVFTSAGYIGRLGQYRRGNDFVLTFRGNVDKVYRRGDQVLAEFRWKISGAFDTMAYHERFPKAYHDRNRLIHKVAGEGRAIFNVTRGVLVSQNGQVGITITERVKITERKDGKIASHKWHESINRHIMHYQSRLLSDREPDPKSSGM